MCCGDLSVAILQQISVGALQNARTRTVKTFDCSETRCMFAERLTASASFHTEHFYVGVTKKRVEKADGIRATANASNQMIGEASFSAQNLFASFFSDDFLKIAHDLGIGMRAEN